MASKWFLLATLAGIYFAITPGKAAADNLYTFVEVNCNPDTDSFEIKELRLYNEKGENVGGSPINDPPNRSGTYGLDELLIIKDDQEDPVVTGTKTLKKTCRLHNATFTAEIKAWKFNNRLLGRCGGVPPSVDLSLSKNGIPIIRNLVFAGNDCHSLVDNYVINSMLIRWSTKEIVFSATIGAIPVQRVFSIKRPTTITPSNIFSHALTGNLNTDLLLAARKGDVDSIRTLLKKGAPIENATDSGETALMVALGDGHAEAARELLNSGANANQKDDKGRTPLMVAVKRDSLQLVELLIEKGADVNAVSDFGGTAITLAASNGSDDILRALIKNGANVNWTDRYGGTALQVAAMYGYSEAVKVLLDSGVNVDARDQSGRTALSRAVQGQTSGLKGLNRSRKSDHASTVRMLKEAGAK